MAATLLFVHVTPRFGVIGTGGEDVAPSATTATNMSSNIIGSSNSSNNRSNNRGSSSSNNSDSNGKRQRKQTMHIFLDINEPYTRRQIIRAFCHPSRQLDYRLVLGPGDGMEAVCMPPICSFQWSEYERVHWDAVTAGKHGASSYMIRKGMSRKAQLAFYTRLYTSKHPACVLRQAMPLTVVIETWSLWDDDTLTQQQGSGLADVVTSLGTSKHTDDKYNQRVRLDNCLREARELMLQADAEYERGDSKAAPMWILKGSTVNKGCGIYIVHVYEELVDICWSENEIREW
jgi:hypothetical protein